MDGVTLMDAVFDRDAKKSECWNSTSIPYRSRTTALDSMREIP